MPAFNAQTHDANTRPASHLALELPPTAQAPGMARAAVHDLCSTAPSRGEHTVSAARSRELALLVSETVTNAVRHTGAPAAQIFLTADVEDDAIHVAITDSGHGFGEEAKRHAGGYGLFLLDKLASQWGVDQAGAPAEGTRLWFDVPLRDAA